MDDKQLAKLLDKYLNGTCTAEEKAIIQAWYAREGDGHAFLEALEQEEQQQLKAEMLDQVLHNINAEHNRPKGTQRLLWLKIAAAAIILLVANLAYNTYFAAPAADGSIVRTQTGNSKTINQQLIHNQSKNILRQMLPDSSVVWLNPGASVTFPEKFEAQSRQIQMDGECFFEITKNPGRPFIVRSRHLVTKVWGTSFKISDPSIAAAAKVTVATGKVSVSIRGGNADRAGARLHQEEVLLNPADEVTFTKKANQLYANRKIDISKLDRYKHLNMAFENTTLENIAQTLSRNFSVQISIENRQLAGRTMTADLTELNLPEILEVLKSSMPIHYEISDDHILLKPFN